MLLPQLLKTAAEKPNKQPRWGSDCVTYRRLFLVMACIAAAALAVALSNFVFSVSFSGHEFMKLHSILLPL